MRKEAVTGELNWTACLVTSKWESGPAIIVGIMGGIMGGIMADMM